MASIAAVCRASTCAATRRLPKHGICRTYHPGRALLAAQNFNMPALSPTMTEGNIATWKLKEGDSFTAGDVLLEIETDKAQMDVEAQDDGVLAKIIMGDGSKAVQVGSRIAVTAEPGDDVSSLEIPKEDYPPPKQSSPSKEEAKKEAKREAENAPKEKEPSVSQSETSKSPPSGKATKQTYPLYPSVQHLLNMNGLGKPEADKIPATGPNGRLLKGDILAYVGKINRSYPSELSDRFSKLAHLDLSNIKVASKKEAFPKNALVLEEAPFIEHTDVEVALPISLTAVMECQKRVKDSIGVFLPLSTFIARAAELANEELPKSKTAKPTADELFDSVLGLDKVSARCSRGQFLPQIKSLSPSMMQSSRLKTQDPLDVLVGKPMARANRRAVAEIHQTIQPLNMFTVVATQGDEKRARVFLERVKSVLEVEPGRLVV